MQLAISWCGSPMLRAGFSGPAELLSSERRGAQGRGGGSWSGVRLSELTGNGLLQGQRRYVPQVSARGVGSHLRAGEIVLGRRHYCSFLRLRLA
jgi:hypothetical protein